MYGWFCGNVYKFLSQISSFATSACCIQTSRFKMLGEVRGVRTSHGLFHGFDPLNLRHIDSQVSLDTYLKRDSA